MANRLRRQRDLINRTTERYLETTTTEYAKWLDGSPSRITYYRLDDIATKQDSSLENVHSLTGANSPNAYQKISDVVVYGVEAMDISNEINEKGLQSLVTGELILLPDSVKPYPGDFFTYDFPGLEDHLFRIDEVQFDRASPKKYYKLTYNLYPENADDIFDNLSGEYVLNYDNIGGVEVAVVKKADAETAERTKDLADSMIDRFTTLFYDEDMDMFVFDTPKVDAGISTGDNIHLWSPYLQKFIHDNKVFEKFNKELLTEFYITDIDQKSNIFFSNLGYKNSLFKKVETQNNSLTLKNSLMDILMQENINAVRNLPFGYTAGEYRVASVYETSDSISAIYNDAFHILEQTYSETIESLDDAYKFLVATELPQKERSFSEGSIVYELSDTLTYTPTSIYKITNITTSIINVSLMEESEVYVITALGDTDWNTALGTTDITYAIGNEFTAIGVGTGTGTVTATTYVYTNIDFTSLMDGSASSVAYIATQELFGIIVDYLNETLILSDNLINQLNEYYFKASFSDYVLMPIVIFILKKLITDALT